jgi:phospholipase/carboxylesterase
MSTDETGIELETGPKPTAAVIWLHGLGADGNDFVPIVSELPLAPDTAIRFIFPHAPFRPVTVNGGYVMRAWYDIYSLGDLSRQDRKGHDATRALVEDIIEGEIARGIPASRIVLMGFSQGGAVALYTGLRHAKRLAGIGVLSAYLPLADETMIEAHAANRDTAIFMAHGEFDPVVRPELGEQARDYLQRAHYRIEWHNYPMEHSVCREEIGDIGRWLNACLLETA